MKIYHLLIVAFSVLLLTACSDDPIAPTIAPDVYGETVTDYTSHDIGDYWVYDWYNVTPDGTETLLDKRDSVYVSGDTLIDGRTYLKLLGTFLGNPVLERLYFDSAGSVYSYPTRSLYFTLDETNEDVKFFGDVDAPLSFGTYSIESLSKIVSVPAGDFVCKIYTGIVESLEPDYPHGLRDNPKYFARGVGLVFMRTQYYSSEDNLEMRLVDYNSN